MVITTDLCVGGQGLHRPSDRPQKRNNILKKTYSYERNMRGLGHVTCFFLGVPQSDRVDDVFAYS